LKFNIRDIGPDGLRVRQTIEEAKLRALLAEAGVGTEPGGNTGAELDLVLTREGSGSGLTVLARGSVEARFLVSCARCLGPATIHAEEPALVLTFLPPSRGAAPPPAQTEEDEEETEPSDLEDVDTFAHDGESVDLTPVLRELLVLAIPMAPVCKESCEGLCPICGVDRNQTSCGCEAPAPTQSPWARALAGLDPARASRDSKKS